MPVVPVLMVLYTNDAVEVRYSDGSCLQIAPCGSTFVHHESPGDTTHPVHGMKTIHQRTQFVTSDFKQKVIEALDFRNRFAERPFVCKDLIHPDQIVGLYADVHEVAWARQLEKANYEYLPDGSVRLVSEDEHSSIVLSTHKQDFTVCYLSKISPDKARSKVKKNKCKFQAKSMYERDNSGNGRISNGTTKVERTEQNGKENLRINLQGDKLLKTNKESNEKKEISNGGGSPDSITPRLHDQRGTKDLEKKLNEELNISPISIASSRRSQDNSPSNHGDEDDIRRYSTPTYPAQAEHEYSKFQGQKSNRATAFKQYKREQYADINDGSFIGKNPPQNEEAVPNIPPLDSANSSLSQYPLSSDNSMVSSSSTDNTLRLSGESKSSTSHNSDEHSYRKESRGSSAGKEDVDSGSGRSLFTWVTRHFSCEECPVVWRHPLNIARTVMDNKESLEEKAKKLAEPEKSKKIGFPHRIQRDKCIMTSLPRPLSLTCPGQHLHKSDKYMYDADKSLEENILTFKQGKLKIMLIEGIVLRLVRLASTSVIEVFPGDGSVILSQGLTAHFYRHIIPRGHQQIEERTYSLKSLPPTPPAAVYSIEKLLKRANRFLLQAAQEDKIITKADVCCWKYVDKEIEILPTSVLEDCVVPGHGKFTAFSNGHVRIVFQDRTSLDMMCDFSQRIQACLEHREDSPEYGYHEDNAAVLVTKPSVSTQHQQDLCKLMLPNGQYQIVDIKHPGIYSKYTNAALEWQAWVNSTPSQRKCFYEKWDERDSHQVVAAKELQKIKCFNYIVENTVPSAISYDTSYDSKQDSCLTSAQRHSAMPQKSLSHHLPINRPTSSQRHVTHNIHNQKTGNCAISSQNFVGQGQIYSQSHGHLPSYSTTANTIGMHWPSNDKKVHSSHSADLQTMLGFNSVREALMKTSQAIKDIDDILEKK